MDEGFTIGELAKEVGIPTSTIRYYERFGLLSPDGRTASNYRIYGELALDRVRFIRAAQSTGFSLTDVVELLALRDGTNAPCKSVQSLIENRLTDITKRMEDLIRTEAVLKSCLKICRKSQRKSACKVLDGLKSRSSSPTAKNRRRSRS